MEVDDQELLRRIDERQKKIGKSGEPLTIFLHGQKQQLQNINNVFEMLKGVADKTKKFAGIIYDQLDYNVFPPKLIKRESYKLNIIDNPVNNA